MRLFIFIALLTLTLGAQAQGNFARTKNFLGALKTLGAPPSGCLEVTPVNVSYQAPASYKDVELNTRARKFARVEGEKISVMTKSEAQALFEEFKRVSYLPTKYLEDGCYARAHELALIAKENGIGLGKAFMVAKNDAPILYPKSVARERFDPYFEGWKYHAVSYILVEEAGGKVVPYVFDIGVADKIQTFDEWKKNLTKRASDAKVVTRARDYVFPDGPFTQTDTSIIDRLQETEALIDEIGMPEYKFRLEQGWL